MANGSGEKNGFRYWLPLWLFLGAQAGMGIWWMATISSDIRAMSRDAERMNSRIQVLDLQQQKLDRAFAIFEAKGGRITIQGDNQ